MTTNESVIISALTDARSYDHFRWVSKMNTFISSQDIHEPFRFRIVSIDGLRKDTMGRLGTELLASCSLFHLGSQVGEALVTGPGRLRTATGDKSNNGETDTTTATVDLDEWICFPLRISDIPLDAMVCVTVLGYDKAVLGGTTFHPFSSRGQLKSGSKRYKLFPGQRADGSEFSTTLGKFPMAAPERLWRDKLNGRINSVPWLDSMTSAKMASITAAASAALQLSEVGCGDLKEECEEAVDNSGSASGAFYSSVASGGSVGTSREDDDFTGNINNNGTPLLLCVELPFVASHNAVFFSSIPADFDRNFHYYDMMPNATRPFYDMDLHVENLTEQKASVLSKSLYLVADVDAQPGPRERKLLREILRRAPVAVDAVVPADEASLLWKYRYFLRHDVQGFIPFMQCVDWSVRSEVGEAEKLVPLWKTIAVEDALMCLSFLFATTHCIRKYAVEIIRLQPPSRIRSFLLQLVQGIRYDVERELADFVLELCYSSWEMCSDAFWFATVEAELERPAGGADTGEHVASGAPHGSGSGQQTAQRPAGEPAAAPAKSSGRMIYTDFVAQLVEGLRRHSPQFAHRIDKQVQLRGTLVKLFTTIFKDPRDRQKKMVFAKELIGERKCGIEELFSEDDAAVHLPSHPTLAARGMTSDGFYMFKSAKMPIAVTFCIDNGPPPSSAAVGQHQHQGALSGGELSEQHQLPPVSPVAAVPQPATTAATHYHEADADDGATFSAGRLEDEHGVEPVAREVTSTFVSSFAAIDAQRLTSEATVAQAASPVSPSAEQPQLAEEEGGHRGARVDAADSASASTSRRPQPPLDEEPPRTSPPLLNTNATNVDSATSPEANSPTGDDTTKASRPLEGSAATTSSGRHARELQNFDVIFKCGDDIRQDQLVIQIIQILDAMLKQNGLDLCLTPYTVLATSVSDGFVEKVANVETLQTVQRDMGGVVRYLQSKNHAPDAHKRALHRFVKSCAGYCVITFLLGIGDRHLENLLITTDGRLLHIDFGFIFGNDPKPFPPPMKINKEMVDAFGGVQSEGYASFKKYCCSAYIIIRKHAKLILSLLLLMVDASIPQIWDGKVDRRVNVLKVQEKLRLELSDAEATQYIQNVIADSVGSVFTNLWDVIHVAAQAARN